MEVLYTKDMLQTKTCGHCKKEFRSPEGQVGHFCSRPCRDLARRSKPTPLRDTKKCSICGVVKTTDQFHRVRKSGREWRQGRCVECNRDYMKQWSRTPQGRAKTIAWSRRNNLASFGMTEDGYQRLLASQGGGCAICGRTVTDVTGRRLAIDHDHETNEVRGLLCHRCNVAIGLMKEDVELLRRAILYLVRSASEVA